jgi:phosphoribosylformylglycinamidine synthase subunit PurQ / glutaminase
VPRFAVCVFPGSNCEEDVKYALEDVLGQPTDLVWHKEPRLEGYDAVLLPGGFAHGDYLRPGALARFSPVMDAVLEMAGKGKPVVGICNGFQMLQEAGLLPGAMLRNRTLTYICRYVGLRVEHTDSPLTATLEQGEVLRIPIGHADGNYFADDETLDRLDRDGLVLFRYVDNPNGAERSIAGIRNERGNVVALMPHPDRCYEPDLGTADGRKVFESLVAWTKDRV